MPTFLSHIPRRVVFGCGFFLLVSVVFYLVFVRPPQDFPQGRIVIIPESGSLEASAEALEKERVIRSPVLFSILVNLFSRERIIAGGYVFEKPLSVVTVALRTSSGNYGIDRVKITFPEGLTSKEMATLCSEALPGCSLTEFATLGRAKEGYLFPDTYFFVPSSDARLVISILESTFERKVETLKTPLQNFGRPLKDILTMASILEDEATSKEDRRIVAGILWRRIAIGMPLQVDAAFRYIEGLETKTSNDLTAEDLKIESPYNTYTHKGLPPTPIGNPGLEALEAAVTPIKTPYLYYLTDKDGVFHYAKTFEEHVANKKKYLR